MRARLAVTRANGGSAFATTVDQQSPGGYERTMYTPHQKKIIERYYDRRDEIILGKLQEIVTELYLAESDRKRDQLWQRADKAMKALKVPESVARHILTQTKPEILAKNVRQWLSEIRNAPP